MNNEQVKGNKGTEQPRLISFRQTQCILYTRDAHIISIEIILFKNILLYMFHKFDESLIWGSHKFNDVKTRLFFIWYFKH